MVIYGNGELTQQLKKDKTPGSELGTFFTGLGKFEPLAPTPFSVWREKSENPGRQQPAVLGRLPKTGRRDGQPGAETEREKSQVSTVQGATQIALNLRSVWGTKCSHLRSV